jgi:RNA polymerase sigma factor (sigma-70 family)
MAGRNPPRPSGAGRRRFATTRWSLILCTGKKEGERSAEALATLCETYWYPLYAYARRRGFHVEDAQDLTQAFFARLLERDFLDRAQPERGRFRAFLLASFRHFLANEYAHATAAKRGGGFHVASLDDAESRYQREPAHHLTPEAVYERQWALTLIADTLRDLERDAERRGRRRQFEVLQPVLIGDEIPYKTLAAQLETTEGAVKVAAHRLRRRFAHALRQRIAETVDSVDAIEDELRHLLAVSR